MSFRNFMTCCLLAYGFGAVNVGLAIAAGFDPDPLAIVLGASIGTAIVIAFMRWAHRHD